MSEKAVTVTVEDWGKEWTYKENLTFGKYRNRSGEENYITLKLSRPINEVPWCRAKKPRAVEVVLEACDWTLEYEFTAVPSPHFENKYDNDIVVTVKFETDDYTVTKKELD
jgi:hypothetical protein